MVSSGQQTPVSVPATALSVFATIGLAALSNLENNRSTRPSLLICTYLLLSTLLDIAQTRTLWLQHRNTKLSVLFTSSVLAKVVLLWLEAFEKRSFLKEPYNKYPPEALAGVLNTSFFWWLNTLIQKGHRNIINLDDLFDTDKALSSSSLKARMQTAWRNQSSVFSPFRHTHMFQSSPAYTYLSTHMPDWIQIFSALANKSSHLVD